MTEKKNEKCRACREDHLLHPAVYSVLLWDDNVDAIPNRSREVLGEFHSPWWDSYIPDNSRPPASE